MNGNSPLGPNVDRIDKQIDQWWEHWRGLPAIDRLFYTASNLGDFSLIWYIVGGLRALPPGRRPKSAIRFSALMGI